MPEYRHATHPTARGRMTCPSTSAAHQPTRRRSSTADPAALLLDEHSRPRDGFQAFTGNWPARLDRVAVPAGRQPLQRGLDVGDRLTRLSGQREVAFAFDDHRVALAALV